MCVRRAGQGRALRGVPSCLMLAAVLMAGCDGSPSEPASRKGQPGIRVISRPTSIDTIRATLPEPLVLEVRGPDSLPLRGAYVSFRSTLSRLHPLCQQSSHTCIAPITEYRPYPAAALDEFRSEGWLFADANGRISVTIRNGLGSGDGAFVVAATDSLISRQFEYVDTLPFTVRPGGPYLTRMTPRDTTLALGRRATYGAVVLDRGGAPVAVTPTLETTAGVAISGLSIEANALTDGRLAARYPGTISDSVLVRVVPMATVAGVTSYASSQLTIMDLDGVNRRTIELGATISDLDWMPDGSRVIVAINATTGAVLPAQQLVRLVTVTPDGVVAPFPSDPRLTYAGAPYVVGAAGSEWLYFAGATAAQSFVTLCRMRLDGSGFEMLNRSAGPGGNGVIGISPDGRTTTYAPFRQDAVGFQDIATGFFNPVPVTTGEARGARWNPAGTLVAYPGRNGLGVMRPDGTAQRFVESFQGVEGFSVDWSPDGRWIITDSYYGSYLVEETTLRRINLPYTIGRAAWRP